VRVEGGGDFQSFVGGEKFVQINRFAAFDALGKVI